MSSQHKIPQWSPQDLTRSQGPEYPDVPPDDYIHRYQQDPQKWPVEFFVLAYRRQSHKEKDTPAVLVRPSANGTSRWGLGSGVPITRWMPSTDSCPIGYSQEVSNKMKASHFPEFPGGKNVPSWTYHKIDLRADVFREEEYDQMYDAELEAYAKEIRSALIDTLETRHGQHQKESSSDWESIRSQVILERLEQPNSIAAIQGSLRMSGLFALRRKNKSRYLPLKNAPTAADLAQSMRIYTMFPQMPDPMMDPSTTSPKDLQRELLTRDTVMAQTDRNPHQDIHGRIYTHKSTSNVSNTIHGVYLTFDVTVLLDHDDDEDMVPPALDLFGTTRVQRQWKSLADLDVTLDNREISTRDPKSTFISGFIVRQLVHEGVIKLASMD